MRKTSLPVVFMSVLRRNKRALVGFIIMSFFILMAIFGPMMVKLDMKPHYLERFQPPSLKHPLGTDYAGRDIFAQIVHGSRDVLLIAVFAALFTVGIAVTLGMLAGFKGGWVDTLISMLINIVLTVPSFPVMMILSAMIRIRDPVSFGFVLSLWSWAPLARAIRSQVLSLKERDFIEVAKLMNFSTAYIVFSEMMPNVMPYIAINFITTMRNAIAASVGLMFLGLVPFTPTNWGMMLNLAVFQSGAMYIPGGIWYIFAPIGAIVLFQLGGVLLAYGLDEVFNPRLRE